MGEDGRRTERNGDEANKGKEKAQNQSVKMALLGRTTGTEDIPR